MALAKALSGGMAGSGGWFNLGAGSGGWYGVGGLASLNKLVALNPIVTTAGDEGGGTLQLQGGLQLEDSTGTAQALLSNDGTDVTLTKISSDDPRVLSTLPYHAVLVGADAVLDIAGVYPNGLLYAEWTHNTDLGGSGSVSAYGCYTKLGWDSTDNVTGFTNGLIGFRTDLSVSSDFGNVSIPTLDGVKVNIAPSDAGLHGSGQNKWITRGVFVDINGSHTAYCQQVQGVLVNMSSLDMQVSPQGSGEIGGVVVTMFDQSADTTDNCFGFHLLNRATTSGTGTITNDHGLWIADDSDATNSYAIWLDGAGGIYFRDSALFIDSPSDGTLHIEADTELELDSPIVSLDDSQSLQFGTGNDAGISYDGTNLLIDPKLVGTGYIDTNASDIRANVLAAGDADPSSAFAFFHAAGITTSSYLAILQATMIYEGSGTLLGCFQSDITFNGSAASPDVMGAIVTAHLDTDNRSAFGVAECFGTSVDVGFEGGSSAASGFLVFYGNRALVLPSGSIGGTHTGGDVYAYGFFIPAFASPVGVDTQTNWGIWSGEDIAMVPDAKLQFDTALLSAGNTVLYYDSGDSTLKLEHDGTASTEWNGVNIGIGGTAYASNAILNYNQTSSTVRNALAFTLDYTGSSNVAGVLVSTTNNSSATSPTANSLNLTLTHSVTPSGTCNVHTIDATTVLDSMAFTQGTHHVSGALLDFTDNSASNTGGTFYRKAIKIPSWGTVSGVTGDTAWGIDTAEPIVLRDDVQLVLGGTNTTQNTSNTLEYDSGNSRALLTGDIEIDGDVTVSGTNQIISGLRSYFDGGDNSSSSTSRYLEYNNGTLFSATNGYCMPRNGSITAVSCSAQVTAALAGSSLTIQVRKNGTSVFTSEQSTAGGAADYNWSATQDRATDTFVTDDVITLYIQHTGTVTVDDVCALVEVTWSE